ncbi:hypothetical protein GmRootV15_35600 [Variovorax sp. V15]
MDLAVVDLSDFEPETVRPQVDCCEAGAVLHVILKRRGGVFVFDRSAVTGRAAFRSRDGEFRKARGLA